MTKDILYFVSYGVNDSHLHECKLFMDEEGARKFASELGDVSYVITRNTYTCKYAVGDDVIRELIGASSEKLYNLYLTILEGDVNI